MSAAAYGMLLPSNRWTLHYRVAVVLTEQDDQSYMVLARHWLQVSCCLCLPGFFGSVLRCSVKRKLQLVCCIHAHTPVWFDYHNGGRYHIVEYFEGLRSFVFNSRCNKGMFGVGLSSHLFWRFAERSCRGHTQAQGARSHGQIVRVPPLCFLCLPEAFSREGCNRP